MPEREYKPNKAYWRDVIELDKTLFDRGMRDSSLVDRILFKQQRKTEWNSDKREFRFSSVRMRYPLGEQHLGSTIYAMQELPVSEVRSLNRGQVGLLRKVKFVPTGILSYGNHDVREYQHTIDLDHLRDATEPEIKDMRSIAQQARREQNRTGFSIPTEETYVFILDTLKQGEEATRFLDPGDGNT
ncbi:MAG: hypothetical protein ACR2LN_07115 [Candidatus Levyibacteriota bacterium]